MPPPKALDSQLGAPRHSETPVRRQQQCAETPARQQQGRSGAATAQQHNAGDTTPNNSLTTRCLLEYCAQWPQHRGWVKEVLAKDGFNLEYLVGTPFAADKELVHAGVSSCGSALQFAAPQLRADPDIVLTAVQSDPFALGSASHELRADGRVVLAALQRDPAALALADASLFRCGDFMLAAIRLDATAATYAAPQLLADPHFRAAATAANSFVGHFFVQTEHFPGLQEPAAQQEFQQQHD